MQHGGENPLLNWILQIAKDVAIAPRLTAPERVPTSFKVMLLMAVAYVVMIECAVYWNFSSHPYSHGAQHVR